MTGRLRRMREDTGAILIFAILIVTTIALVVGTVLTHGDTSLRATVAYRNVAGTTYAADAAAQVALNDLRTGHWAGTAPKPAGWAYANDAYDGCFGRDGTLLSSTPVSTLSLPGLYPATGGSGATSAAVECTPEDATGKQGTPVAINDHNKPGNAILTLGTSTSEDGFTFKTNGSGGAFRVRGGIWSASNIKRDNNGVLESTESIQAQTGCTPLSAMSAPLVNCTGVAPPPDPGYQSELDVGGLGIPPLRTPPSTCSGGTVELYAGYYDDASRLNALTPTGGSGCFLHFNPGTYYFDFHNNSADPLYQAGIAPAVGDVWNVNSGTIVGGALVAGVTGVPGRCVSPIDDVSAQGVQLIMGGDSRIAVDKGAQVELCASYHADRPPIAVYGQKTGGTPAPTSVSGLTSDPAAPPGLSPASGGWIHGTTGTTAPTAADLAARDGNVASFKRAGSPSTAVITATGFRPSTAIPVGAVLTAATVRVAYAETSGSSASLTITPDSSSALPAFGLPGSTPAVQPYPADLSTSAATFQALQRYVHDNGLTKASIAFSGSPKANGDTMTLDSLALDLKYYVPQVRGETTTAIPANVVASPAGQPLISAQGNTTVFYTQGTTYAPLASIYLALNNISESVFRFGVIVRSLNIFETASFSYPNAVIELPDDSPGWGTKSTLVRLKVYLCPGAPACSTTTGRLALVVRAQVWDEDGTPSPNDRKVAVLSWSHQR